MVRYRNCDQVQSILVFTGSISSCWFNLFSWVEDFPAAVSAFFDAFFSGFDEIGAQLTGENAMGLVACKDAYFNWGISSFLKNAFANLGKVWVFPM